METCIVLLGFYWLMLSTLCACVAPYMQKIVTIQCLGILICILLAVPAEGVIFP